MQAQQQLKQFYEVLTPGLYSLLSQAAAKESMPTDFEFAVCCRQQET
jgi:hypothetical protein